MIPITESQVEQGIENPCVGAPNTAVIQCPVSSGMSFDVNARGSGRGPVSFTKQNLLVLNF